MLKQVASMRYDTVPTVCWGEVAGWNLFFFFCDKLWNWKSQEIYNFSGALDHVKVLSTHNKAGQSLEAQDQKR